MGHPLTLVGFMAMWRPRRRRQERRLQRLPGAAPRPHAQGLLFLSGQVKPVDRPGARVQPNTPRSPGPGRCALNGRSHLRNL